MTLSGTGVGRTFSDLRSLTRGGDPVEGLDGC